MLSVRNLNTFYGKSHIIQNLSINVAPDEIVGLLGRNGVGKTTTLKAIMGLVKSRSGDIFFHGADLRKIPTNRIAQIGVGYVPQGRHIFPHLTVFENLKLAWQGRLFDAGTLELALSYFEPLKNHLNKKAGNLSGGEQQMLAISRVLTNKPSLVLLDEPVEGLMPIFVKTVAHIVVGLRREKVAVLLVEQNLKLAKSLCSRICFMEKGTIKDSCTTEEAWSVRLLNRYLGLNVNPW